jgi:dihydrofolate reductase
MPKIILIIAIDKNGVMGHNLKLPWKLSDDLKNFKKETLNCPIIMGKNTYKSLPKLLPDREHIVMSSKMEGNEKISVFSSIKNVLDYLKDTYEKAYIIGGAKLAEQFLHFSLIDEMIITHVNCSIKGNVKLDMERLSLDEWTMYEETKYEKNDKNQFSFQICKYIPKKKRFY